MKIIIAILLWSLISFSPSFAQSLVKGIVLDRETKQPIHGTTVYINNSSSATSSAKDGSFQLSQKVIRNQELIISNIGYDPASITINNTNYDKVTVFLNRKITTLDEVTVIPFEKDGWTKWGKYFTEVFIGTSKFALKTKIINPEVIRFRYNKSSKTLTVIAHEPIQIDNKELGYYISYDLISFRSSFSENTIQFEGFSYFKDYKRVIKKMKQNRKTAYKFSMMRFIRSTYRHEWSKDGYEVRELIKKQNMERKAAHERLMAITNLVNKSYEGNWSTFYILQCKIKQDTVTKYRNIMRQPEYYDVLGKHYKEADLETGNMDNDLKEIKHDNYLYIWNKNETIDSDYFQYHNAYDESTRLKLTGDLSISINEMGNYSPSTEWLMEGFFAWYSKVGNLLPFDYNENN
ncbi:carboxypeptidase-like regulatory domain-containing protein [Sphingobacterium faecium]